MNKWRKILLVGVLAGVISFLMIRRQAIRRARLWNEAWDRDGEAILEELFKRTNQEDPRLEDWAGWLNQANFGALADYMLGGEDD